MNKINLIIAIALSVWAARVTAQREIPNNKVITPYSLEVSFDKTIHIIFPDAVMYIDLGSANIIAGKADAAENVVRVKAAVQDFENETNFSVITKAGNFYAFNVKYSDNPQKLNIEMKDTVHDGKAVDRPNNAQEVYLSELGKESPKTVYLIMKSIHMNDKKRIKHIGSKRFGVQYMLKSIYSHSNLLYFHTEIDNKTRVIYDVDFITFKITDKEVAKRTAIQETIIKPVRVYNYVTLVRGKTVERTVFAFEKFTIPDDKQLVVKMYEKKGGRHQSFVVENRELIRAKQVDKLKTR